MCDEGDLESEPQPEDIQGYLCASADPRRAGTTSGGEDLILTAQELRLILQFQSQLEDQTVWLTTAQAGFPTTATEEEFKSTLDCQLGRPTSRCLHPAISAFILQRREELVTQHRVPSAPEARIMELEDEWVTQEQQEMTQDQQMESNDDGSWEPDPPPLMAKHPPRITASNTKILLQEGILSQPCPTGEDDLGWIQLQQKSLTWREQIEGSSVVTHEGLSTMAHSSRSGWTILSGTWNHLREIWGPTLDTLAKIQASCNSQTHLEEANVFTPTRHLLLTIKQLWGINRVHGLPAVTVPAFFTSASKGNECWWGTQDSRTVYLWDSMDDKDRQDSMDTLRTQDTWIVWKTKDKVWTQKLQQEGFAQILTLNKDKTMSKWSTKIKGWWRRGDIRATKPKKSFECWVKSAADAPKEVNKSLMEALMAPQQNAGKDEYIVDLESHEKLYWLGTESGLIGAIGLSLIHI